MKSTLTIFAISIFSLFLVTSAANAGDQSSKKHDTSHKSQMSKSSDKQQDSRYTENLKSVNNLSGTQVYDSNNENIGEIGDMLVDTESGKITFVMLKSGGVFGVGGKDYPIPFKALKQRQNKEGLRLQLTSKELKDAPRGTQISSRNRAERIHEFYGVSPYWEESDTQKYRKDMDTKSNRTGMTPGVNKDQLKQDKKHDKSY